MDAAATTGWFTVGAALGGLVAGAGLDALRSAGARRRADAGARDETYAGVADACTRLLIQVNVWRNLGSRESVVRQALYGLMEHVSRLPAWETASPGILLGQVMSGVVHYGLRHNSPVEMAERARRDFMPLLWRFTSW